MCASRVSSSSQFPDFPSYQSDDKTAPSSSAMLAPPPYEDSCSISLELQLFGQPHVLFGRKSAATPGISLKVQVSPLSHDWAPFVFPTASPTSAQQEVPSNQLKVNMTNLSPAGQRPSLVILTPVSPLTSDGLYR